MPRNYEKNKAIPVMLNRSQIRVVMLAIKSRLAATGGDALVSNERASLARAHVILAEVYFSPAVAVAP